MLEIVGFKDKVATASLKSALRSNTAVSRAYEQSFSVVEDLTSHYTGITLSPFFESKIRFLLSAQATFVAEQVRRVLREKKRCDLVDIGDSDGSLQQMIRAMVQNNDVFSTVGVNLQPEAVKRIQERGLDGMLVDAMELTNQGLTYDIVTVMETLEHLPNPIGFLESIHDVVRERLVVSVPYVRSSRVGLAYLDALNEERRPTIENVHIFELAPADWRKIFRHSGWAVAEEWIAHQYGPRSFWRLTAPVWRRLDFEGFWLVSLQKDRSARKRYGVE